MDPATATPITPRYDLITEAAQVLNRELSCFSSSDTDDSDEENSNANTKTKTKNNNKEDKNEDLEREILFLRSSLEYFYSHGVHPSATQAATQDFCNNRLIMPQRQYIQEHDRFRNKYKKRVLNICKKLQPLKSIREQDAFELGNRIWGSMSLELMMAPQQQQQKKKKKKKQQEEETMDVVSAEEKEKGKGTEKEEEEEDDDDDGGGGGVITEGVLDKYPALERALKFCGDGVKIPDVLNEVVVKGVGSLGADRVQQMDEHWKEIQIEKLKGFMTKILMMMLLGKNSLDELRSASEL